jgi:DNA-binding beta-propeller fold protein YncE
MMKPHATLAILLLSTALTAVAANAETARVFIPEGSADAIRIVDAVTGQDIGRISGTEAVHGLAGSPNSRYLIAGSYMEIDQEDAAEMSKPASVSEDEHAAHHAKPQKALGPSDAGVSLLSVIDAATGDLLRKIEVPGAVHHVAISPDGRFAVSTHPNSDGISVVDLDNFELFAWIPTGSMPNYAIFGADPGLVYVSNAGNGTVSEVDLELGIVRRNMIAGEAPEHLTLSSDGGTLFVADADIGRIVEIDLSNGRDVRTFEIGGEIHGLDLSEDQTHLLVAAKGTDRIVSIDLRSGNIVDAVLSPAPYHLTTIPGTGSIFVSSRDEPKVWIVDAKTLAATSEIPIEGGGTRWSLYTSKRKRPAAGERRTI